LVQIVVGFRCFRRKLLFSGGGDGSTQVWRFCGLGVAVVSFFAGLAVVAGGLGVVVVAGGSGVVVVVLEDLR
jgi:hypothetical protein